MGGRGGEGEMSQKNKSWSRKNRQVWDRIFSDLFLLGGGAAFTVAAWTLSMFLTVAATSDLEPITFMPWTIKAT